MDIPKFDEMYKEILLALADGEAHPMKDVFDEVARLRNISIEETAGHMSFEDRKRFIDRVRWARSYLKQAGLLEYPKRGHSRITAEGKKVLKENPAILNNKYLEKYESFKAFLSRGQTDNESREIGQETIGNQIDSTPQEQMEQAFAQLNASLGDELLIEIMQQSPAFFEQLVVQLLLRMGYGGSQEGAGIVTSISNDEGIDGIIKEDKLGFSNIYIQAKRWDCGKVISRPEIQKFKGAISGYTEKGLFITSAKFSQAAEEYAKAQHIVLVDGARLVSLMIEFDVGVSTERAYETKKIDSDFFVA